MSDHRIDPRGNAGTENLIILQLLRKDKSGRWSRAELEREFHDVAPAAIAAALEHLQEVGVVCLEGEQGWASPCTRHLNALGMICL
jgi:hypothetical protein